MTDGFHRSTWRHRKISNERRMSQCEGKEALTPDRARQLVRDMAKRKSYVQAYRCAVCKNWHVGADHTPKGR